MKRCMYKKSKGVAPLGINAARSDARRVTIQCIGKGKRILVGVLCGRQPCNPIRPSLHKEEYDSAGPMVGSRADELGRASHHSHIKT